MAMGEKFPDLENVKKKKKPRPRKKSQKVSLVTRKFLRNINKVVNYRELPLVLLTGSGGGKKPVKMKVNHTKDISKHIPDEINSDEVKPAIKVNSLKSCTKCNDDFQDLAELKNHINKYHKRKMFNCPVCELPMFSKEKYKMHFSNNHRS